MANKNAVNYQQEMADRGTEQSNYSSLEQRRDEEATYSEIQQSDRPQHSSDQPKEKYICNSKIQICLKVIGMVALVVASCILTAIILQQKIDSLRDEMKSMKMNISEYFVSDKPVIYQESNWLEWTHWSECSVSCSGGIKRRTRTCNGLDKGPHVCVGNDVDISACNNNTCVESNWLEWTHWSECSVSCSGGIQRRTRTCNGPDNGPHVCVGNDFDIAACNNNTCVVPMVYFTMTEANSQLVSGKVTFSRTVANIGGGYNDQTGEFVCPVSGLYHFFFSFVQKSTTYAHCYIKRNDRTLTQARTSSDGTYDAASTSVYIQLAVGDVVTVGGCTNWQYVGWEGVFTGSLIHL